MPTPRLPVVGGDPNTWGTLLNEFLLVSFNADGTLKVTGSMPAGGSAGQLLGKLSDVNGDYGFYTPAHGSTNLPKASGVASPGVGPGLSFDDHVHADSASAAAANDAYAVAVCRPTPIAGDIYALGANTNSSLSTFGRGQGYPFRIGQSGTYKLGVSIKGAGGVGSTLRIGVFADDNGGEIAGTYLTDLGTPIDASSTGLKYMPNAIVLSRTARYHAIVSEQGGSGTHPSLAVASGGGITPFRTVVNGTDQAVSARYGITGAYTNNPVPTTYDISGLFSVFFQVQ